MQSAYINYEYIRKIPYAIVNKLTLDCPEIWKLLKYDNPLGKTDVPIKEISKMICPDSMNIDRYNVVFQKYSQQALAVENSENNVFAQMRIQVLNGTSLNRSTGIANVLFEFIVNEKKMICDTSVTPLDNRATAMLQAVISCLNGKELSTDDSNYVFIDEQRSGNAGFKLVNFNNEYSGYQLIMSINILG